MNDYEVVNAFVRHLRQHGNPGLRVDRCPDQDNRDSADIDAVAGKYAIEHTSVDTLPNQRRDSDWFLRVVGNLEQELDEPLPFWLNVALQYDAVSTGQDWKQIREALRAWIAGEASGLADGHSVIGDAPGVPYRLHVTKRSDFRRGLYFSRYEPRDGTLSDRIKAAVERKAKKLAQYQEPGVTTVLLVESNEIALMNDSKLLTNIQRAFPSGMPTGVDQLWYVDSSIESEIMFRDFTSALIERAV